MGSTDVKLSERTFNFGVDIQNFLISLPQNNIHQAIALELSKLSIEIGEIYDRVCRTYPTDDVIWRIEVILSKITDIKYKLQILAKTLPTSVDAKELTRLTKEIGELESVFKSLKIEKKKIEKERSKPQRIPHLGKISFIIMIFFGFLFIVTENIFLGWIVIIATLVFSSRLSYHLFSKEWDDK